MADAPEDAERYWLETLQLVASRAAHELKGALNGVSVNLEVVRGRSAQADQPASAVARFAASAGAQLDRVIDMNEALLGLARQAREPMDVAQVVRHVAALLAPVASAGGGGLAVTIDGDGFAAATRAPGAAVRAVVGRVLLALLDAGGGRVHCRLEDGVVLQADAAPDGVTLDAAAVAIARDAGIGVMDDGMVLTLTFPVAAAVAGGAGSSMHGTA